MDCEISKKFKFKLESYSGLLKVVANCVKGKTKSLVDRLTQSIFVIESLIFSSARHLRIFSAFLQLCNMLVVSLKLSSALLWPSDIVPIRVSSNAKVPIRVSSNAV